MTNSAVDKVAGILLGVKLTAFKDKAVRDILLKDYLAVRKEAKAMGEEQSELVNKFNADWKDNRESEEYRRALQDLNDTIRGIMEREVEVAITPVGMDAFMDEIKDDHLTFEQIAILAENGLLT